MICKIEGCYTRVMTFPDKTQPSVVWRSKGRVNVFFPSVPAEHGKCYYHWRMNKNQKILEASLSKKREKMQKQEEYLRRLHKLSGRSDYEIIKSPLP